MTSEHSRRDFFSRGAMGAAAAAGAVILPGRPGLAESGSDGGAHWPDDDAPFDDPVHTGDIPDPAHLRRVDRGWVVRPNGVDDHDNLEFAMRHTAPGGVVRLVRGTYKIGRPIVVPNFDGVLRGAGANRTILTCTDELSVELWEASGGGPVPPDFPRFPRAEIDDAYTLTPTAVFVLYKTPLQPWEDPASRANRIVVKNLRYRGSSIGELTVFGDETAFLSISNSFDWNDPEGAPETTRQDVVVSGVLVDGYSSPAFGPLENAYSCIAILGGFVATPNYDLDGVVDGDALGPANGGVLRFTPAEGDVSITASTFRNCRNGPLVMGYAGHRIRLANLETGTAAARTACW